MFTTTRFDGWDLPQDLLDGLSEAGFEHATAVQKDTIPIARIGTDLIGQARTGSGKTIAFGLPVLESYTQANCKLSSSHQRANWLNR